MSSDKKIQDLKSEISTLIASKKELEENISSLENILFNPSEYREAFALNSEKDLFEVMKDDLVEYIKKNPEFKKYLMKSLDISPVKNIAPVSSNTRISISSPAIFSPKRSTPSHLRGSSRPILDN